MYLYERLQLMEKEEKEKDLGQFVPASPPINNDKRYVALMSSMSHTYGNALAFIQNWVLNIFPKDMFKTIHVNSKIAHRQLRSTPNEYLKKTKPMIAFRPRIPSRTEEKFLQGTPLIERQTDIFSSWGGTNLQPFFKDHYHDLRIDYQLNRTVFYVDVVVVLSTLMQQLDYYHYIQNAVRIEKPFTLSTCLESYLPQEMLSIISDLTSVPLYDNNDSTKSFLEFMNGHSEYPITYKLEGSSGNKEFYRYYPVDIETTITDLEKDDGDRVGNVMNQYQINFTVKMEFYSTGFYYLFSDKIFDINLPKIDTSSTDIIPVFTDVLLKEDLNLAPGWTVYNRASCRLDKPDDIIKYDELLNNSIRSALKYYLDNGLPIGEFFDLKVRRQGYPIKLGKDYTIDYEKGTIQFYRGDTFHTYSIIICINIELINDLIKKVYNLK